MENTKGSRLFVRISAYVIGLLIMTLGVAISVKSNLGVSPVSSIPYTITCVVGLEMGKATILFHVVLVLFQILLLRRAFQAKNLLQIFAGILFGYFTTFCNSLMVFFPDPTNLIVRLAMMLFSTGLIAFGLFWYVPADIIPLAGEGAMLAISKTIKKPFPTVKIAFDVTMVVISLITCLICLHSLGSVGIGTIVAAVLVGMELRWITKKCGSRRYEKRNSAVAVACHHEAGGLYRFRRNLYPRCSAHHHRKENQRRACHRRQPEPDRIPFRWGYPALPCGCGAAVYQCLRIAGAAEF